MTEPIRIDAFGDRIPYRTWVVAGLECAAYPVTVGILNGYVRLPEGHPDRVFAQAADADRGATSMTPV